MLCQSLLLVLHANKLENKKSRIKWRWIRFSTLRRRPAQLTGSHTVHHRKKKKNSNRDLIYLLCMGFVRVQQSMARVAGQLASPSSRVMLYKLSCSLSALSSSGSTPTMSWRSSHFAQLCAESTGTSEKQTKKVEKRKEGAVRVTSAGSSSIQTTSRTHNAPVCSSL